VGEVPEMTPHTPKPSERPHMTACSAGRRQTSHCWGGWGAGARGRGGVVPRCHMLDLVRVV
jgi:hypothetical protein